LAGARDFLMGEIVNASTISTKTFGQVDLQKDNVMICNVEQNKRQKSQG
jgi:hypothetical protein